MGELWTAIQKLWEESGFARLFNFENGGWKNLIMIGIACVLIYLAIKKQFEPLLLLPIAFGMLLVNLPLSGVMDPQQNSLVPLTAEELKHFNQGIYDQMYQVMIHTQEEINGVMTVTSASWQHFDQGGLMWYLYQGVKFGIYPPLIFLGIGAMTDFGPLIANPRSFLLGAAAQLGIFATFIGARALGLLNFPELAFTNQEAASIAIIGGADGPTAIYLTSKLAPHLLGAIAVAAYSYMALVPIIQPVAIKAVTTKKERQIRMPYNPQSVSRRTRILFPIIVIVIAGLVAPASVSLVGMLMFGNLLRECLKLDSLSQTAQTTLANLITIVLGLTIAASMKAGAFLTVGTVVIMGLGLVAFVFDTIGGVMFAKLMNLFLPKDKKINPMVGGAGISAFPMSARVIQKMALKEDNQNHLLMHAVGANVAGQIGSVVAGGIILTVVPRLIGG